MGELLKKWSYFPDWIMHLKKKLLFALSTREIKFNATRNPEMESKHFTSILQFEFGCKCSSGDVRAQLFLQIFAILATIETIRCRVIVIEFSSAIFVQFLLFLFSLLLLR